MALRQMNRFEEAITASQKAATLFRAWHDPPLEGQALLNLAMALRRAHRFDEAIAAYKAAVAIFRYTDNKQAERLARDNLKEAQAARRR
jgi:tetratricopeptide (TPR) repeat protein